jgi:hypothetical protein
MFLTGESPCSFSMLSLSFSCREDIEIPPGMRISFEPQRTGSNLLVRRGGVHHLFIN